MTCYGITESGEKITLNCLLSLYLNQEDGVPADDLTAVFSVINKIPVLSKMTIVHEGETLFTGIVDEQIMRCNSEGKTVKLMARSLAALLLDNEAKPEEYKKPSASVLFLKHIAPFLNEYVGEDTPYNGSLGVNKGVCHWQVLEEFCRNKYNCFPRINEEGKVILNGKYTDKVLTFSNGQKAGCLPYTAIEMIQRRHKMLSSVWVRTQANKGYDMEIVNEKAKVKGIVRQRYLNVVDTEDATIFHADKMIEKSNETALEIMITSPLPILRCLGATIHLPDEEAEEVKTMKVCKVKYTYTQNGHNTVLTLCEKE